MVWTLNTPAGLTNHLTSSHTDEVRALIGTHGSTEAGVADLAHRLAQFEREPTSLRGRRDG